MAHPHPNAGGAGAPNVPPPGQGQNAGQLDYDGDGFNPYDNRRQIEHVFMQDNIVRELFTLHIGSDFLNVEDKWTYALVYIACSGRTVRDGVTPRDHAALTLAIANAIAPRLRDRCIVDTQLCRKEYRECTIYALCDEMMKFFEGPESVYNDWNQKPAGAPAAWADFNRDNIPTLLNNVEFTASSVRAVVLFHINAMKPRRNVVDISTSMYIHAFVALAKRGVITDQKCDQLNRTLMIEGTRDPHLSVASVSYIGSRLGGCVDENTAEITFSRWMRLIGDLSLRSTILLQQTANAGLTAYLTIYEAHVTFPTFKWAVVRRLVAKDYLNYLKAVEVVGVNRYYGFKKNLGIAASTNYKSLAYVSKEVLLRYGGAQFAGLRGYLGWTRSPANKVELDTLVNTFEPLGAVNIETPATATEIKEMDEILAKITALNFGGDEEEAPAEDQ
nr:TPA_asm: nucleocapsid protein [Belostoma flumineum mononega-like virus]